MKKLLPCLLLLCARLLSAQTPTQTLHDGWQFRKLNEGEWLPATVPGTVHTDLVNAGKIPDPFIGTNEKQVQWVENEDWEYRCKFTPSKELLAQKNIRLVFEGLDTYASVYLNSELVLETDNMFRSWRRDVKQQLKKGSNELRIVFASAVRKGKEAAAKLPYTLPGDEKVFTRKAQYQYGWDWGPRLVTCGIWKTVRLEAGTGAKAGLDYSIDADGAVRLTASFHFYSDRMRQCTLRVTDAETGALYGIDTLLCPKGRVQLACKGRVGDPRLWWCRGLGPQHFYRLKCTALSGEKILMEETLEAAFRQIELVRDKDAQGETFYFRVNGVPVFAKGANYIPPDNFLPRVTTGKRKQILLDACAANMNMIRVWGGGVYETDEFYSLCDSLGLLVWQDFMYACAMYPGDSAFFHNASREAEEQVLRLKKHPCIALWCGNNEIDEGWKNWGWQKQYKYSAADSTKIWNDYLDFFEMHLRLITLRSGVPYWPSSPSIGWGHAESLQQGDSHYWGVWWGMEPFEAYEKKVGRFMSEYGFQGMPPVSTLRRFAAEQDLSLRSEVMKQHQKHPKGFETIQTHLERDYRQPKNFESYVYVSQLLQARGITMAIRAHRRARPYCMGTLYWQLNDCWPVTSWSGVDHYGSWKALHYAVKDAYKTTGASLVLQDDSVHLYVVNDSTESVKLRWSIHALDVNGNFKSAEAGEAQAPPGSKRIAVFPLNALQKDARKEELVLNATLAINGQTIDEDFLFLVPPKALELPDPKLGWKVEEREGNLFIKLKTERFAKNVFLEAQGHELRFSDNFFDMRPGEKSITVHGAITAEQLKAKLNVRTLRDTY